jgi:hypothetical protein
VRRSALVLLLTLPLAAAGTLVAHEVAYSLLDAPSEGVHGYLEHLPLLLTVLALPALLALAVASRAAGPRAWPFAAAALGVFVAQEHLERLAHTGELPLVLDRPVFWVGLLLQLPFALAAWLVARALVGVAHVLARRSRVRVLAQPAVLPAPRGAEPRPSTSGRSAAPRGPPAFLPAL